MSEPRTKAGQALWNSSERLVESLADALRARTNTDYHDGDEWWVKEATILVGLMDKFALGPDPAHVELGGEP